jgi:hypothetical protein
MCRARERYQVDHPNNAFSDLMATGIHLPTEHFEKIACVHGVRLPARRIGRHLTEDAVELKLHELVQP